MKTKLNYAESIYTNDPWVRTALPHKNREKGLYVKLAEKQNKFTKIAEKQKSRIEEHGSSKIAQWQQNCRMAEQQRVNNFRRIAE